MLLPVCGIPQTSTAGCEIEVASTISRDINTGMSCLLVETVVCGYHIYKVLWEPCVGETSIALREINSK